MQQRREIVLRDSRSLRLRFPHRLGKLDHLTIGETMNKGRYFVERLTSKPLLQLPQVYGRSRTQCLAPPIIRGLKFVDGGTDGHLSVSRARGAVDNHRYE